MYVMINEANAMQRNRNAFNKILSGLKKEKNRVRRDKWSIMCGITLIDKPYCNFSLRAEVYIDMTDFYLEKGGDKIFVVAKLKCEVYRLIGNYWHINGEDTALILIKNAAENLDSKYSYIPSSAKEALRDSGLTSTSSDSQILSSKIYKVLKNGLDEIQSTTAIKTKLDDRVAKQLKTRENVLPVMWYNESTDSFNYPIYEIQGDNLNSRNARRDIGLDSFFVDGGIGGVCRSSIQYAPVKPWVHINWEDVPIVDHNI